MIETLLVAIVILLAALIMITGYILLLSASKADPPKIKKPRTAAMKVMFSKDAEETIKKMEQYNGGVSDGTV